MGLFYDKIFAAPIKNLVSLSTWNQGGNTSANGDATAATGRGNRNCKIVDTTTTDDDRNEQRNRRNRIASQSFMHHISPPSPSPSPVAVRRCESFFNTAQCSDCSGSSSSNSNHPINSMYLSCISSSSTPPSPSPPSPQFAVCGSTGQHNASADDAGNPFLSPSPMPLPMSLFPSADFAPHLLPNDGYKYNNSATKLFDCVANGPATPQITKREAKTTTAPSNGKIYSNQTIKLKSLRRTLHKDDETKLGGSSNGSRHKAALKAVLMELQTSLALAKTAKCHKDASAVSSEAKSYNKAASTANAITQTTKQTSNGVPFIVQRTEILNEVSRFRRNDCFAAIDTTAAALKRGAGSSLASSKSLLGEDDEAGSASMQQLSTSWEFIKLEPKPILDADIGTADVDDDSDDRLQDVIAPPRFIKISDGKICLGPANLQQSDNNKEKEILERRVLELESTLQRVQDQLKKNESELPTLEKDFKEKLQSLNRTIKSKEKKASQACRDQQLLQARFENQEAIVQTLQQENKLLQQRVRQYEHCLDDVMRKVVDTLLNEDNLREEVAMLKSRVKDLEAQNAALSNSPAKGKDEGYCTMSSGQPQPSNSHLEDLPEEPEQWLMSGEPNSAEMEDWSMSQDELGVLTLDDDGNQHEHDWIWNSSYLNSTMIDSQSEGISQLLRETIVYSDDEELTCTEFTRDFYKLVNMSSGSTHSLYSHMDAETDDEDDDEDDEEDDDNADENHSNGDHEAAHSGSDKTDLGQNNNNLSNGNNNNSDKKLNSKSTKNKKSGPSPTPSEAGRALVTSCSSSESDEIISIQTNSYVKEFAEEASSPPLVDTEAEASASPCLNKANSSSKPVIKSEIQSSMIPQACSKLKEIAKPSTSYKSSSNVGPVWRKSNGWKRIATSTPRKEDQPVKKQSSSPLKKSKIPPPVPVRRFYAS